MGLDLEIYNVDESPKDDTEIIQVLLYYSKQELEEFRSLCKIGIKKEFGKQALEKGNVSDFILTLLKNSYGKIHIRQEDDGCASGGFENDVPPI